MILLDPEEKLLLKIKAQECDFCRKECVNEYNISFDFCLLIYFDFRNPDHTHHYIIYICICINTYIYIYII